MATEAANWTSQTNWTIASGSLLNCIAFQSDDGDSTTSKPLPLLLHSPTPDSPPCEITINFANKHELRQIYVRSTARVYEIYYAPDLQSNNEYLCTVRCGVATRDGEILRSSSTHEIASSLDRDSGDESVRSEDDWLEVKVVDSDHQDLFEATAEVDDMNPCISVTLRLLSLQSKGRVCVDEIYVFADPVDSEIQEIHNESSSSSSLMAMFLPTLMQLSKTTGLSHLNSVRKEKQIALEDDFKETPHPSDSVTKDKLNRKASVADSCEEKLKEVKGGLLGPSQPNTLSQAAKMESNCGAVPSQASQMDSNCSAIHLKIAEMENYQGAVPSQVTITDPHEEKLKEVEGGLVGPSQHNTLSQVAKMESDRVAEPSQAAQMDSNRSAIPIKTAEMEDDQRAVPSQVAVNQGDFSGGNVERVLEKFMSRMDRIEEICLGFQEKMVMPMNNIEARLQRVEQQLDTLSKKFQNSEVPSGYRISAPDVSSTIESEVNFCEVCVDSTDTTEVESEKKGLHVEVLRADPHDMSDSENTTQRVEQQLHTLSKKFQNSELPSGYRISAPDVSSTIESDVNFCEVCVDSTDTREVESEKKGLQIEVLSADPHDMSDSENTTQLLPGLVVTAPEFPDGEDEYENASEQEMNSSNDKEKPSIDDALSSALANFLLSSLSSESPKYTKCVTVKATEFSNEDDDDHDSNNEAVKSDSVHLTDSEKCSHPQLLASSSISLESGENVNTDSDDKNSKKPSQEAEHDCESNIEAVKTDSVLLTDSEKFSHAQVLALYSISLESGENVNNDSDDKNSDKPAQEAEQLDKFCSAQEDQDETCVKASILPEYNIRTDVKDNAEEDKNEKICDQNKKGEVSLSNVSNITKEWVDNQTPGSYSITQEGSSSGTETEVTVTTEPPKNSIDDNIIENVLGFSLASSVVDFEIPVLDVKFISQKSLIAMGFLESLLVETPETSRKDLPVNESNDDHSAIKGNVDLSFEEHSNLISVDDGEPVNPASNNNFILDEVLYTSTIPPVNTEGDNLPEDHSNLISVENRESVSAASDNDFTLDEVLPTSTTPPVNTEGDDLPEDHKRKHDQISTSSLI